MIFPLKTEKLVCPPEKVEMMYVSTGLYYESRPRLCI